MLKKLFLLIILLDCYLITPEIIILKNGKIIDGKIIKMDEDTMTVITKNKEIIIDRDDIIQIFRSTDDYNKFKKIMESNNKTDEKGNLIAEWLFNGNANDTSGNGLHGKVFGSKELTEDRFGNKDSAYEFGIGKTKSIRIDKNLSILRRQIFSISVWVKVKKFYTYSTRIIDFYNRNSTRGYGIMYGAEGDIYFEAWINNRIKRGISTRNNLNNDVWIHIVITYDSNIAKLYHNGEIVNDYVITNINHAKSNKASFYIGGAESNDYYSYQFYGCIDDIRFYDFALSKEEIKELYHENGWEK